MESLLILSLIASVIGTFASIASQGAANQENRQLMQQSQEFNKETASTANAKTEEMYYQIYSPEAKVQQYKDAGLNPALMYQGLGGQGMSAAQAAPVQAPVMNPVLGDLSKMLEAISSAKNADTNEKDVEGENKKREQVIKNLQKEIEVQDENIKKMESEIGVNAATEALLKVDKQIKETERDFNNATFIERMTMISENIKLIIEQRNNLIEDTEIKKIEKGKREQYLTSAIRELDARAALEWAQKGKADAEKLLIKAEEALTKEKEKFTEAQRKEAWQHIILMKKEMNAIDQHMKLEKAQTTRTYVNIGTDCVNSIANVASSATSLGGILKDAGYSGWEATTTY